MFPNWGRPRLAELPLPMNFPLLSLLNCKAFAVPGKFFFGKNCKTATPEQEKEPRRCDIVTLIIMSTILILIILITTWEIIIIMIISVNSLSDV